MARRAAPHSPDCCPAHSTCTRRDTSSVRNISRFCASHLLKPQCIHPTSCRYSKLSAIGKDGVNILEQQYLGDFPLPLCPHYSNSFAPAFALLSLTFDNILTRCRQRFRITLLNCWELCAAVR